MSRAKRTAVCCVALAVLLLGSNVFAQRHHRAVRRTTDSLGVPHSSRSERMWAFFGVQKNAVLTDFHDQLTTDFVKGDLREAHAAADSGALEQYGLDKITYSFFRDTLIAITASAHSISE